jgi:hypothetical protein
VCTRVCSERWLTAEEYVWCFNHPERLKTYSSQPHNLYTDPVPGVYFIVNRAFENWFVRCVRACALSSRGCVRAFCPRVDGGILP